MRVEVTMPNLGYDMESGAIGTWRKQVGDRVARGEVLADVETDKATVEMESLASGTIVEILLQVGTEVPVGTVIAIVETEAAG